MYRSHKAYTIGTSITSYTLILNNSNKQNLLTQYNCTTANHNEGITPPQMFRLYHLP
jgi:hypothetical protein